MQYSQFLTDAVIFAANAHAGQLRKGTDVPYIVHPIEVMGIAATVTTDENVLAAAVLHDTLEDTPATKDELCEKFGERVARLVAAESEDKQKDVPAHSSWKERKQATINHLSSCTDRDVKIIALADKLSNLRAVNRDLTQTGPGFWNRFNQTDPAEHLWYYSSFLDTLSELGDTAAYKEYEKLIADTWK